MKTPKKTASFRLSETTIKELATLAKRYNVSQADVIAVITHCFYMGWDMEEWDNYFEIARLG
jgi:hypothetical protein